MNPHKKETRFLHNLDEPLYYGRRWHDTDMWVETGGLALIIGTISFSSTGNANLGFRLLDENNEPLFPYRTPTNARNAAHFTAELYTNSKENLAPITFHMIVNCKCVKLQFYPDDFYRNPGIVGINHHLNFKNAGGSAPDYVWSHKPISTMTAIPLLPHYQGGANTVFTYPSRMPKKDKTPKSKVL